MHRYMCVAKTNQQLSVHVYVSAWFTLLCTYAEAVLKTANVHNFMRMPLIENLNKGGLSAFYTQKTRIRNSVHSPFNNFSIFSHTARNKHHFSNIKSNNYRFSFNRKWKEKRKTFYRSKKQKTLNEDQEIFLLVKQFATVAKNEHNFPFFSILFRLLNMFLAKNN